MHVIEDALVQYGTLGLWTISLLLEKYNQQKKILDVLNKIERKIKI